MKIVMISDTHHCKDLFLLDKLPEGDLLLHAGDATFRGYIDEIKAFNKQLERVKDRYTYGIILSPGNHDFLYEIDPDLAKQLTSNATVLIDEPLEVNGVKIYCSPWQPRFFDWAFNVDRGDEIKKKWDKIPTCDILVTHGPPYGFGDLCRNGRVGCYDLLEAVKRVKPKFHLYGHIHEGYGTYKVKDTTFVNASLCDGTYGFVNDPIICDV